jgi:hypothetical protein
MNRHFLIALLCLIVQVTYAQDKLTIDKVYSTYLRNSGTIMENNQIKGYFFLYQSDKIDRNTNEYILKILDQHLNPVREIKFEDSKKVYMLEAAYNGGSLAFLFQNGDTKTLDMKIYDLDGKLKYTYSREYDKKTNDLMATYQTVHSDEGTNQNVFNMNDDGYVSVLPLREGKQRTYEVDFYSSNEKKQWSYVPTDNAEKFASAEYLGSTDSLIILQELKRKSGTSQKLTASLVGINVYSRKKAFEIEQEESDEYKFFPNSVSSLKEKGAFLVMGTFFDQNANIAKDASRGLGIYEITTKGKIVSRTYNTWAGDFAKYLPTNAKGKVDKIGFLYIHKMIQSPDGKLYVVGEGYKRTASAGGIALTALGALGGAYRTGQTTQIVITDMVMMEFNDKFKVTNATIFDKTNNTVQPLGGADFISQHALALQLKSDGAFDYEFTTFEPDNSNFTVCYSDWVRSGEYKGKTFNTIRYNGDKYVTDKIQLKSSAKKTKIFPAKAGSIMIMEYYKKEKKIDLRLEKIG